MFTIGQQITIVFGSQQPVTIVAAGPERCCVRLPGGHGVKWYRNEQLRLWNPTLIESKQGDQAMPEKDAAIRDQVEIPNPLVATHVTLFADGSSQWLWFDDSNVYLPSRQRLFDLFTDEQKQIIEGWQYTEDGSTYELPEPVVIEWKQRQSKSTGRPYKEVTRLSLQTPAVEAEADSPEVAQIIARLEELAPQLAQAKVAVDSAKTTMASLDEETRTLLERVRKLTGQTGDVLGGWYQITESDSTELLPNSTHADVVEWIWREAPLLRKYLRVDFKALAADLLPLVNNDGTFPAILEGLPVIILKSKAVSTIIRWARLPDADGDTEQLVPVQEMADPGDPFLANGHQESAPEGATEPGEATEG